MARLDWYWHRLQAMSPAEIALRGRKKFRELNDSRRAWPPRLVEPADTGAFPMLPDREAVPDRLRKALASDVADILAGRWRAFGQLDLTVDDPPKWQRDYLAGRDLTTGAPAFTLDHRHLADGADVKLIWELSRWNQLVRLAMAVYLLDDERSRGKCLEWLEDWVARNPPFRGWNWTSALEAGIRLIQFAWIDALLTGRKELPDADGSGDAARRWAALRGSVLPPHLAYVWRHRSFGSSANNHLLGELAGCIVALARWPRLAGLTSPLEELQRRWEREVLAQFADDGGNKEQALHYHLFAFELCWQALKALDAAGRAPSSAVRSRLTSAAQFFLDVEGNAEAWDYGDSDDAWVTPVFAADPVTEWREWLETEGRQTAIGYWLGAAPTRQAAPEGRRPHAVPMGDWLVYPTSGLMVREAGPWRLRWDVSPLGYLTTAAHGHLDALHVSVWLGGRGLIVDPGTGAYYGDAALRAWLASRSAHNAPCPQGPEQPRRLGPFLWAEHHPIPTVELRDRSMIARLDLPDSRIRRRIAQTPDGAGWTVDDSCLGTDGHPVGFTVRWQFAPECVVEQRSERQFAVACGTMEAMIELSRDWETVDLIAPGHEHGLEVPGATAGGSLAGIVSPGFRRVCRAPFLVLAAEPRAGQAAEFRSTFSVRGRP
jgi:hypothetical protein